MLTERGAKHGTVKVHDYYLNGGVMINVQYKAQHCMKSYNLLLICHMSNIIVLYMSMFYVLVHVCIWVSGHNRWFCFVFGALSTGLFCQRSLKKKY